MPAMIGYWDHQLHNVMANEAYVAYFGRSLEQIRGTHISELLGPDLYARNLPTSGASSRFLGGLASG